MERLGLSIAAMMTAFLAAQVIYQTLVHRFVNAFAGRCLGATIEPEEVTVCAVLAGNHEP